MKKISKILAGTLGVMVISMCTAIAEPTFTPLNFDDSTTIRTTTSTAGTTVKTTTTQSKNTLLDPSQVTGGSKMQNAILQLDNAQTDVRNQLLNYKANYAELDSRYTTTKAERKAAKKKVKQAEKQIKNLEKAKSKIRTNFEQKNNI